MKSIPAIVEKAIDVERSFSVICVALAGERDADKTAARHEQLGAAARATAALRRREVGLELLKVRGAWPKHGPGSSGWTEFLKRIKLDDSTALRYMQDAKTSPVHGESPTQKPRVSGIAEAPSVAAALDILDKLDPGDLARVLRTVKATNVKGGSGEGDRGKWCTSKAWAVAVGPWDHDPFSNPRSMIASVTRCMLEDGGDAFGGGEPGATPGLYLTGDAHGIPPSSGIAGASTRVWIQPPYELVAEAIAHYGHTRFCALLRWSPDVKAWFPALWERTAVVCHPFGERVEFEPPPGVDKSGDMPFPHALYYADERDITDEVRARCIVWRVDHSLDCARSTPAALHVVR